MKHRNNGAGPKLLNHRPISTRSDDTGFTQGCSVKVSNKASPAGEAPVEVLFVPGASPPVAYVTNMYGGSLWTLTWNASAQNFDAAEAFNFGTIKAGIPLEIYFNDPVTRMYVTTAKPGHMHIFDVSGDHTKPKLLKSLPTGEGAHHIAFTKDWKLAFVQNTLLNLPGMSEGNVTVVDLTTEKVVAQIDTLQKAGYNPNLMFFCPSGIHSRAISATSVGKAPGWTTVLQKAKRPTRN